jgi:hypothetical protein
MGRTTADCANFLGRSEEDVRQKAAELNVRFDGAISPVDPFPAEASRQ